MRTLVVQTAWLGDTVFTSALVDGLTRAGHTVDLCVSPRGKDIALAMPAARAVHVYDKRGADRGVRGLWRMAARLRAERYDLAVLPHQSVRSAALAFLARIPRRIGFARAAGSFLYTSGVRAPSIARVSNPRLRRAEPVGSPTPYDAFGAGAPRGAPTDGAPGGGFLEREGELLAALDAPPGEMRLRARPEWIEAARVALGDGKRRFAALCIGSEWETKIWPPERYAGLARILAGTGLTPVLMGGPRERELAARIRGCVDTVGNEVGEALGILSLSTLCVGGDSGLVHAARALGVPTVVLFGPTSSAVHDFGPRTQPVSLGLDCSPCSAHGGRRCPLGHHRCMRDLDEERVARACHEVLVP